MAAPNGGALAQKPQFFKIIFPRLSHNLFPSYGNSHPLQSSLCGAVESFQSGLQRIPRRFHTHLPSELPKTANLLCPHAKFWDVEIHQSSSDLFFQRGWLEFMKAHDLRNGYILVFEYNGHMNFEVKIFDTTCCLKDYSLKHCSRLRDESKDETQGLANSLGGKKKYIDGKLQRIENKEKMPSPQNSVQTEQIAGSCKRQACIEIENLSKFGDQMNSKVTDDETQGLANSLGGKKKYIDGKLQRIENKEKMPSPQNSVQTEQIAGSCKRQACIEIENLSKFGDQMNSKVSDEIQGNYLSKRRKLSNPNDKEEEEEEVQKDVQGKKTLKTTPNFTCFDQFEKILTRAMVESYRIGLPREFCVKNGLISNCSIFLKRKLEEEGKVVPRKWPVELHFGPSQCRIRKGWRRFSKENNLKIGERCIFQLVSKDTFLVKTVPHKVK